MVTFQTDLRYHSIYGWNHSLPVPKVQDLVVVIDKDHEYFGRVMRLVEDRKDRQTVCVNDDLQSEYGTHIRFNRKGDIRPLSSRDKVVILANS